MTHIFVGAAGTGAERGAARGGGGGRAAGFLAANAAGFAAATATARFLFLLQPHMYVVF